jgi:hypothetical protein
MLTIRNNKNGGHVISRCEKKRVALGMRQHINNPYKVGDGSIFIPDFPRYRYE